jgi:hypothetical protein
MRRRVVTDIDITRLVRRQVAAALGDTDIVSARFRALTLDGGAIYDVTRRGGETGDVVVWRDEHGRVRARHLRDCSV